MRINPIVNNSSFKGTVRLNKAETAELISWFPKEVQPDIIDNLNTLRKNLEATPDCKYFIVNLERSNYFPDGAGPQEKSLRVKIEDPKRRKFGETIFLVSRTGKCYPNGVNYIANKKEIWTEGFEELNEKFANQDYSKEVAEKQESWDEASEEFKKIYDKIEDRGKRIHVNKEQIASSIIEATRTCPDEIKESLIKNINELTKTLKKSSHPKKHYNVTASGGFNTSFEYYYYFGIHVDCIDSGYEEYEKYIALTKDTKEKKDVCRVDDQYISDIFKSVKKEIKEQTPKIPFKKDSHEAKIYNQLI